ncbi:MAG: AAA family ATPase [Pseudomonadota bacterium]
MIPASALGERIMIIGPSNAGKSTLALALAAKLKLPVTHLDQLHHLPNTDWRPRPEAEFKALHDQAISAPSWIIEGNYSRYMPKRFERATGAILITSNRWLRLARYLKRTVISTSIRAGHLEGGREYVKWSMIDWILFKSPQRTTQNLKAMRAINIPTIECHTIKELKAIYQEWELPSAD